MGGVIQDKDEPAAFKALAQQWVLHVLGCASCVWRRRVTQGARK
jgi:hypothetical protein